MTFNAQASKGFRLGGVNDPLNLPLCSAEDAAIFGGFQSYDDETLWNYEAGMRSPLGASLSNAARLLHRHQRPAGDARRRILLVAHRVQRAQGALDGRRIRAVGDMPRGLDFSLSGSVLQSEFDSTVLDGTGNVIGGIRRR